MKCFYCHHEGEYGSTFTEMTPQEIERIVKVAASFNILKVKLTGGEPLLRKDIVEIVDKLSHIPKIKEVAITTNGILLKELAKPLQNAGLVRVNVSLGALDSEVYKSMVGVDTLEEVLKGIDEAKLVGLSPIKVNMVMLKGLNEGHLQSMIDFTKKNGLILQIIEFESPNPNDATFIKHHLDLSEIEETLKLKAEKIVVREMQDRKKYFLTGGGEVEVVKPMHNTSFCSNCSRLRITSDGKFKPCLFRQDNLVDFLTPMRREEDDNAIKELLLEAVSRRKPFFA